MAAFALRETLMPTPATIYCRTCSYNLHGLPENRCPECGNTFDPTNRKTFRRRPRAAVWRWVRRVTLLLLVLLIAYGGFVGWLWRGWKMEQKALATLHERAVVDGCDDRPHGSWLPTPACARAVAVRHGPGGPPVDLGPVENGARTWPRSPPSRDCARSNSEGDGVTDDRLAFLADLTTLRELSLSTRSVRGSGFRSPAAVAGNWRALDVGVVGAFTDPTRRRQPAPPRNPAEAARAGPLDGSQADP